MAAKGELPSHQDVVARVAAEDPRIHTAIDVGRHLRPRFAFDYDPSPFVYIANQAFERHPADAEFERLTYMQTFGQIAEVFLSRAGVSDRDAERIIKESALVHMDSVLDLQQLLVGEGPRVIVMRHGTQHSDLASKLDLMRQPQNQTDPLTTPSAAQAVVTGVILATIAEKAGKRIRVVSSENTRAIQTGAIVAGSSSGSLVIDKRLTCLDYPPVSEVSDDALLDRLGRENNGAVIWKEGIVENVFGYGAYKRVTRDMADILVQYLLSDASEIVVVVTHTQQTNACDVYAEDKPLRLRELGMRVFTTERQVLLPNGVFIK